MDDAPSHRRDFLSGKAMADQLAARAAEAAAAAESESESEAYLLRVGRRAMACDFEVLLNLRQYAEEQAAALAALDRVDLLEQQLSVYRDDSEVSELNRHAAYGPVVVESRLFALLQQAVALHRATDGAFDITAGPLSRVWGFVRRQGRVPTAEERDAALAVVGSQKLSLNAEEGTVAFRQPGMEINLGAIGKGYALDCVAEELRAAGVADFMLHGGRSSLLASGSHAAAPSSAPGWVVSLHDPMRPSRVLAEVRLWQRAMGTSGAGTQFFRHDGARYGHILDPRTGLPAQGVLSVTVVAPTAAAADALSTAFYVMGREATAAYCAAHPQIYALLTLGEPDSSQFDLLTLNFPDDVLRLYG